MQEKKTGKIIHMERILPIIIDFFLPLSLASLTTHWFENYPLASAITKPGGVLRKQKSKINNSSLDNI